MLQDLLLKYISYFTRTEPFNFFLTIQCLSGRDISSGKVLGYGLDDPVSIPGDGLVKIFLQFFVSRLFLRSTQPPVKLVPGLKMAEHRASHPTSS